jgi:hypothetical protein
MMSKIPKSKLLNSNHAIRKIDMIFANLYNECLTSHTSEIFLGGNLCLVIMRN